MKKSFVAVAMMVFCWQVYRAAMTAITPREAILFTDFASKPFGVIVASPFDPANQILHTVLVARFIRTFRLTEFTFRLASLLGFAFYLLASFRIINGRRWGWAALLFFLLNPFTIGLLPESNGRWMAAALFLFGLNNLLKDNPASRELNKGAFQLAIAVGFQGLFAIPVLLVTFGVLVSKKRPIPQLLHEFVMPICLISPVLWGLTILRTVPGAGNVKTALLVANAFHSGPEAGLPRASRALRDDIRRHDFRVVKVAVSDELAPSFEFYRRRYALGATSRVADLATADYWMALDTDSRFRSGNGVSRVFQRDGISVFRRD